MTTITANQPLIAPRPQPAPRAATPAPVTARPVDTFERVGTALTPAVSIEDQVYTQLMSARDSGAPAHLSFLADMSPVAIRRMVQKSASKAPSVATGEDVVSCFNDLKMKKLKGKKIKPQDVVNLMLCYQKHLQDSPVSGPTPSWAKEVLVDSDLGTYEMNHFMGSLKTWMEGGEKVGLNDLGINFSETSNNKISVHSDKEDFWPVLMKDLRGAEESVNINIFGLMGDEWGKEVFDLLIEKAKKGVKVRVMADALGARMHWYFGNKNEDFIKHLRDNGIEVVITRDDDNYGNFHFDHRKFFVIDGKLAHNTGYTIEEHMRKIHFDMGMRIQGDMVKQMQASFFTNWIHFGGEVKDVSGAPMSFDAAMKEYFPTTEVAPGDSKGKLLLNIPHVQHRATETYYEHVSSAKEKIMVINEFLSDNELMDRLYEKAKEGVEVEILFPRECEWEGYRFIAYEFFDKVKDMPNVKCYIYDGPQDTGWLHTKGIAIDGRYINFGSTNMDELSLYHNYEQNIETEDPDVVKQVEEKIFDYAKKYSKLYDEPESWSRTIKTFFYKLFKRVIEP